MAIFRFSCFSSCGSYFSPYLKQVIIKAETLTDANKYLEDWLKEEGLSFIDEKEVSIEVDEQDIGVIHYDYSSDY
jgi:hypothetical protein